MKTKLPLIISAVLSTANLLQAQPQLTLVQVASGFTKVVDITHAGDSRLFVVEKTGYIRIIDSTGNVLPSPFLNIDARVGSTGTEQGLLGLAFSPNYATDGFFYVNYTNNSGDTRISRFSVSATNPDSADENSEENLLAVAQPYTNHNGGSMAFGKDGFLYIGLGDGGSGGDPGNRAQNKKEYLGKILRIDVSNSPGYVVPPSNPFVNDTTFYPEIWNWGMRNPWRYSFDKITGEFWIADVGQTVWEEINLQPSGVGGQNYGWRCYEGNAAYNTSGCGSMSNYTFPVHVYQHSGINGCSITGGYVYRGGQFNDLFGYYLYTDFCSGKIWGLTPNGTGGWNNNLFGSYMINQYSTFGEDVNGELYIAALDTGKIYHITTSDCSHTAYIIEGDTLNICGATSVVLNAVYGTGSYYQWKWNGTNIPGANSLSDTVTQDGAYTVEVSTIAGCTSTSQTCYVSFHPAAPAVSFAGLDTFYCANWIKDTLIGSPAGGIFSGAGITGNVFDPAAAGNGNHVIQYFYTDSNGCSNSQTLNTVVDACTGINETKNDFSFKIIPNPNDGNFYLEFSGIKNDAEVEVYNSIGQKIYTEKSSKENSTRKISIDLRNQSTGIYLVMVKSEDGIYMRKMILKK